ncbi:guanine deaminase [Metarhizium album ARSEF 1941]|uniref:Probable guanine deaminase n=1 Tax=Metarhizium album (strain ARSEF 1941) TaxID=1081103 RepID=A0A0B2WWV8_METAS|nr:guanine deaminase [Metarhizium album ARSEF 1941]KHN97912.1 guanine deaminase [Metarhizium album ARSEF 1941]
MVPTRLALEPRKFRVLVGTFVHSKSRSELEYIHDAAVAVDDGGTIVAMARGCENGNAAKDKVLRETGWTHRHVDLVECGEGQFFFPGFIDTHVHASQYPNAGIFGKSTLLDWLEKYTFPLESSLADLAKARKVYTACVRRCLSHGTTTAAYYATVDVPATNLLADLCLSLGQRAFVGRVCMDREELRPRHYGDESAESFLHNTQESIAYIKKIDPGFELISPILTPRFAPSCSSEGMKGLSAIHRREHLPIQTHVSENKGEIQLVADMYPESGSYAEVYDDHGLLTPKTILAHAVHITEKEARLISQRESKVSHCPCSNSSLTSGEARVRWMWEQGIEIGLGTDMSGGYSPSMLEAARQATLTSRHLAMRTEDQALREKTKLTVEEALYLATRGGARCLGLDDKVGGFEVGKQLDAQLIALGLVQDDGSRVGEDEDGHVDAGNVDVFGWETWDERIAKWLYNGDDRNTKKVWVKGRLVHSRR